MSEPDIAAPELRDDREAFGLQVAGGGHHLNNIFAQVLLNAELLDRSRLDEMGASMMDSIVKGVHSAIHVVDLLASQSTAPFGEQVAFDLKYLVKGLQKRREAYFPEGVVINAQYPPEMRLAWARPSHLFHAVLGLCRLSAHAAPERQSLFIQVMDVDEPGREASVAIDIAAPANLVAEGLRAGADVTTIPELSDVIRAAFESGGTVSVVESATGGTLIRFLFSQPPTQGR